MSLRKCLGLGAKVKKNYSKLSEVQQEAYIGYEKAREKLIEKFFDIDLKEYLKIELGKNYIIKSKLNSHDYKYKITITNIINKNEIIFGSKGYGTNNDYYIINGDTRLSKYRYRYDVKSIDSFYIKNGATAKEYYLKLVNGLDDDHI